MDADGRSATWLIWVSSEPGLDAISLWKLAPIAGLGMVWVPGVPPGC